MALVTVNGFGVVRGCISLPRLGAWHADLDVDTTLELTPAVQIVIGKSLTLKGTVHAGGMYEGIVRTRIVAGANGLRILATPRHYVAPQFQLPLKDMLRGAGEALAPTSDATTMAKSLNHWSVIGRPTGEQISALIERSAPAGTIWRVLADGTLWVGVDTWPASGLTEYRLIDRTVRQGRLELGLDAPTLLPGTKLGDFRIDNVEHIIDAEHVRSTAWTI
jgi:hypothetical protein